jgi:hypothetical protein
VSRDKDLVPLRPIDVLRATQATLGHRSAGAASVSGSNGRVPDAEDFGQALRPQTAAAPYTAATRVRRFARSSTTTCAASHVLGVEQPPDAHRV